MVHSVKVLDREACMQGYLKVAIQLMQEERRSNSTPSSVEFREQGAEENNISSAVSISTLASSIFSAGDLRRVGQNSHNNNNNKSTSSSSEDGGSQETSELGRGILINKSIVEEPRIPVSWEGRSQETSEIVRGPRFSEYQ